MMATWDGTKRASASFVNFFLVAKRRLNEFRKDIERPLTDIARDFIKVAAELAAHIGFQKKKIGANSLAYGLFDLRSRTGHRHSDEDPIYGDCWTAFSLQRWTSLEAG